MLIKAKYDGKDALLNTDYIVDILDVDKPFVSAYVLDCERGAYKIEQSELERFRQLETKANTDAVIISNMDMPKDCYGCNIQNCEYFADRLSCDGRPSSCPLKSADKENYNS